MLVKQFIFLVLNIFPRWRGFCLQSYFYKKENLLSGLIFNKENITIRPEYETGESALHKFPILSSFWSQPSPRNLTQVLRFYGYDLDGATNMLTESKMNETAGNMTNVTDATDTTVPSEGEEAQTTTLLPETSEDETTAAEQAEDTTEENAEAEEDVTTVAPPSRKRRGRLGRGLKMKNRREGPKSPPIKSPVKGGTKRLTRSYYVLLDEDYENEFHLDSTSPTPPPLGPTSTIAVTASPVSSSPRPSLGKYRKNNPPDLFDNVNSDTVEHIFYLNDFDSVRVPFKIYDSVMKYAHVESLEASVLEIDLDTEYYNLIIIVPDHPDGLRDLTNKLRLHEPSTLRRLRNAMEFYWVKTIVPKFNLKGNTILTNDLQNVSASIYKFVRINSYAGFFSLRTFHDSWKRFLRLTTTAHSIKMGMNDIFEPTKADFTQLADDKTLYVKNVEQMININIRTQTTQQLKSNCRALGNGLGGFMEFLRLHLFWNC